MLDKQTIQFIKNNVEQICKDLNSLKFKKDQQTIYEIGIINDFLNDQNKYNNEDFIHINFDDIFKKYPEFNIEKILDYNFCKKYFEDKGATK